MAVVDRDRFDETVANPRNIFEHRRRRMPERQMDVDLPHVADMRDHRQAPPVRRVRHPDIFRSEEHTSELQSLMRISYAVFCLKKKTNSKLLHTSCNHTQLITLL